MSENKRYYWLKFQIDFFQSKRIKKLRKLGADFVIIYLKLMLLSLNNNGILEFDGVEKTLADELALDIDEDADKVQLTLAYLQSCGLLETKEDTLFLPYVEMCTGSETQSTRRSQKLREKRKKALQCNANATLVQRECNGEIEIEKDIDIDNINISKDIFKSKNLEAKKPHVNYQEIIDEYNSICVPRLPKATKLTQKREKKIPLRLKEFTREQITLAFKMANESDFLCGINKEGWKASFDWLFESEGNMLKVLEGNYKNKNGNRITINPAQREGYTDDIFGEFE